MWKTVPTVNVRYNIVPIKKKKWAQYEFIKIIIRYDV